MHRPHGRQWRRQRRKRRRSRCPEGRQGRHRCRRRERRATPCERCPAHRERHASRQQRTAKGHQVFLSVEVISGIESTPFVLLGNDMRLVGVAPTDLAKPLPLVGLPPEQSWVAIVDRNLRRRHEHPERPRRHRCRRAQPGGRRHSAQATHRRGAEGGLQTPKRPHNSSSSGTHLWWGHHRRTKRSRRRQRLLWLLANSIEAIAP
mmetsp:Transcript_50283/g.132332  ORF Transcript_50283/g.132332 Transcript_50283/m.132332 type:complete len:205 (+) Transcript_50283:105-719(+)